MGGSLSRWLSRYVNTPGSSLTCYISPLHSPLFPFFFFTANLSIKREKKPIDKETIKY